MCTQEVEGLRKQACRHSVTSTSTKGGDLPQSKKGRKEKRKKKKKKKKRKKEVKKRNEEVKKKEKEMQLNGVIKNVKRSYF